MMDFGKKKIQKIRESQEFFDLKHTSWKDLVGGGFLSKSYILGQLKLLLLITALLFIYMDNRMICERDLTEIDQLSKELADVKYRFVLKEAELQKMGHPAKIKERIQHEGLLLEEMDKPPFQVLLSH